MDTNRHEWSAELLRSFVYLVYFVVASPGPWPARVSQAAAGASPADSTAHRQLLAGRVSARFSEAVGCGGLPQASGTRGGHGILRIQNAECGMQNFDPVISDF